MKTNSMAPKCVAYSKTQQQGAELCGSRKNCGPQSSQNSKNTSVPLPPSHRRTPTTQKLEYWQCTHVQNTTSKSTISVKRSRN